MKLKKALLNGRTLSATSSHLLIKKLKKPRKSLRVSKSKMKSAMRYAIYAEETSSLNMVLTASSLHARDFLNVRIQSRSLKESVLNVLSAERILSQEDLKRAEGFMVVRPARSVSLSHGICRLRKSVKSAEALCL